MRPTTRPNKPYTPAQIIDMVERHFITEGNPRCSTGLACHYNKTGCAVGCLMTERDANDFETSWRNTPIITLVRENEIYKAYFGDSDDNYRLLQMLQEGHDRPGVEFLERMTRAIANARLMYVRPTPTE